MTNPELRNRLVTPLVVNACVIAVNVGVSLRWAASGVGVSADRVAVARVPERLTMEVARGLAAAPVPAAAPGIATAPASAALPEDIASGDVGAAIAKANIEDYTRLARYPGTTEPILNAQDPLVAREDVTQQKAPGPDGTDLNAFPARMSFEAPEAAIVHAYVATDGSRVTPQAINGSLVSLVNGELHTLAALDL